MATKEIGATGRRKTAIARVRLTPGSGKLSVNERGLDDYFPRPTARMIIAQPFQLAKAESTYDAVIKVTGGGVSAQASAIRHAISRALCRAQPDVRPTLKKAGLLTRDPRVKERKKYGMAGARKRFQFSKR
jgi:small subunit ribosomal protein S9